MPTRPFYQDRATTRLADSLKFQQRASDDIWRLNFGSRADDDIAGLDGTTKGAQAASYAAGTSHQVGGDDGTNTKWLNGDIAEVLAYDSALATGDRRRVESYLARKYGLTVA